ncbi:MAG: hypothetical protein MSG64_17835 [Pyrinomonadaceae bacterium MAG19_C2-C3]|nr:hypothetical protein [Pyrinomonadaceae bacterium MAG19_C2-C3]
MNWWKRILNNKRGGRSHTGAFVNYRSESVLPQVAASGVANTGSRDLREASDRYINLSLACEPKKSGKVST